MERGFRVRVWVWSCGAPGTSKGKTKNGIVWIDEEQLQCYELHGHNTYMWINYVI